RSPAKFRLKFRSAPRRDASEAKRASAAIICRACRIAQASLAQCDDLTGIHDVLRVERRLDGPHREQRGIPVFGFEIFHLALADAVLARAGSLHIQSPLD